jgi:hypothetical protein
MDRERMERCLQQVAAYRASGLKGNAWAEANGVPLRALSSWCAHAQRWQARLDGVPASALEPKVAGFVAARVPAATAATVRIELRAGSTALELHWPVANGRELAAWLREVGR